MFLKAISVLDLVKKLVGIKKLPHLRISDTLANSAT